jgi:hypothetical protein
MDEWGYTATPNIRVCLNDTNKNKHTQYDAVSSNILFCDITGFVFLCVSLFILLVLNMLGTEHRKVNTLDV